MQHIKVLYTYTYDTQMNIHNQLIYTNIQATLCQIQLNNKIYDKDSLLVQRLIKTIQLNTTFIVNNDIDIHICTDVFDIYHFQQQIPLLSFICNSFTITPTHICTEYTDHYVEYMLNTEINTN